MLPFIAFAVTWAVYVCLAVVKSRGNRVDGAAVLGAVLLATVTFFVRALVAGTSLDSVFYGAALLSVLILAVTLGDPSLMFDIHQMKGKQFRRLPKAEQAKVRARDRRSGIAQLSFLVIVVVASSLYVSLDWTFLN
ncbi:hypothetical protein OG474_23330 [Kribbella sp. NBC_01505]|uniref:hypothetical protein n=1 Tax=Kribbella sp. NBC_01505 TaxID=2903580 RepID=UPI00386DDE71